MPRNRIPVPGLWRSGRRRLAILCLSGALAAGAAGPATAQQSGDAAQTSPTYQIQPLKLPRLPVGPLIQGQAQDQSSGQVGIATPGTSSLSGQAKAYLRLEGIPGPVAHELYRGWIELTGMSTEVRGMSTAPGSSTARSRAAPVTVLKPVDSASVPLRRMAASGAHVTRAELAFGLGPQSIELYRITLENVVIARVGTSLKDGAVVEEVDLVYERIRWRFNMLDHTRQNKGSLTGCWDFRSNREC